MSTIILSFLVFSFAFSAHALKSCTTVGELKADPENCHNFYQCTNSGWQQLHCPSNLVFNEQISVCDWPKPGTKCGSDDNDDNNDNNDNNDDNNNDKLQPCTTVGELIADPENCHNFYQCTNVGYQQLHCPANLVFNALISVCDWPKPGTKCGNDDDDDDHNNDDNNDDHNDDNNNDDDNNDPDLDPCKTEGQKKADTKHCDLYYQCSSCGWSLVKCKAGELFNPKTLLCDKADRVKCASDGDLEPCDQIGEFKPDDDHCDLYYKCTDCGWALVACDADQLFNKKTLTCQKSDLVQCNGDDDHHNDDHNDDDDDHGDDDNDDDNHGDDTSTTPPLEPCEEISALKPDPENCNKYYECTTYGWQNMPCYGNLVFNPNKSYCDYPENYQCENKSNN